MSNWYILPNFECWWPVELQIAWRTVKEREGIEGFTELVSDFREKVGLERLDASE